MKKLVLSVFMVVAVLIAFAQPKIEFDKKTHDFGDIKEEGGKVTARFTFKNVGDSALILKQVKPGCGCTAANYTREAVAPGETGFIDATYDPWGRPNAFNKNIKVTTNEPNLTTPHLIFIKGNVIKRPPTKYELAGYKIGKGEIRVKENSISCTVKNTESHIDTLYIKNFYENGRAAEVRLELPAYIKEVSRTFGQSLKGGEEGKIVLKYDATLRNDWGAQKDRFVVVTNDSVEPRKYIYYNVNITEDFSHMTAKDIEKAPKMYIDKESFDFGTLQKNESASQTFRITNTGKSALILRKIQPSIPAITYTLDKKTIAPGEYAEMTATFNSKNRRGRQNLSLDIIANDPSHAQTVIKVIGDVN